MLIKASKSSDVEVRCNDRACKTWNTIKVVMLTDLVKKEILGEHRQHAN